MDESILFSIVIPTYNRGNMIERTLNSILAQEYDRFEIIVVDDGSTDNTSEFFSTYKHPKVQYHKKKNEERAVARNTGMELSRGSYINFIDSDDTVYPNHLSEAARLIKQYNNPEFLHLAYDIVDIDGTVLEKRNTFSGSLNQRLTKGNVLSCNGVFLRKDILQQNKFNTDRALSATEDYELWLRLAARYPLHYSNTITSSILHHDNRSLFVTDKDKLIKRIELFDRYAFSDPEVKAKFGKYRDKMMSNNLAFIALHLAILKLKKDAWKYLFRSFRLYPLIITKRIFLGAVKNIIF